MRQARRGGSASPPSWIGSPTRSGVSPSATGPPSPRRSKGAHRHEQGDRARRTPRTTAYRHDRAIPQRPLPACRADHPLRRAQGPRRRRPAPRGRRAAVGHLPPSTSTSATASNDAEAHIWTSVHGQRALPRGDRTGHGHTGTGRATLSRSGRRRTRRPSPGERGRRRAHRCRAWRCRRMRVTTQPGSASTAAEANRLVRPDENRRGAGWERTLRSSRPHGPGGTTGRSAAPTAPRCAARPRGFAAARRASAQPAVR